MFQWLFQGYSLGNPITDPKFYFNSKFHLFIVWQLFLMSFTRLFGNIFSSRISSSYKNSSLTNSLPFIVTNCLKFSFKKWVIVHFLQSAKRSCKGEYRDINSSNIQCANDLQAISNVSKPPCFSILTQTILFNLKFNLHYWLDYSFIIFLM